MSLSIGIVGLPNVGKSTLFQALTKKQVDIANYPFCTIDPNVGIVEVPDERLKKLAELSRSKRIVPTVIEFVDIAGLVRGANKGEGLGNQFLANIREVDAVLYLLRAFSDEDIHHVEGSVDAVRDFQTLRTELALKDLETVEKSLSKAQKEAKSGAKEAIASAEVLAVLRELLNSGGDVYQYARQQTEGGSDSRAIIIKSLQLLTAKPAIVAFNIHEGAVGEKEKEYFAEQGIPFVSLDAKEELEGGGLSEEERGELGIGPSRIPDLIHIAYDVLNLITFLTTGEDETRAWTIARGTRAPQASGVIHTDFEEKFIRAEVIQWEMLLESGGWGEARAKGLIRLEGKDYVIQDGDVIIVRHG